MKLILSKSINSKGEVLINNLIRKKLMLKEINESINSLLYIVSFSFIARSEFFFLQCTFKDLLYMRV